jgi:hypothetical protein
MDITSMTIIPTGIRSVGTPFSHHQLMAREDYYPMNYYRTALRQTVVSGILISILAGSIGLSWAEQVIRCPWHGVNAQLKTDVQGATATQGQPFDAALSEDVRYKNWVLPVGTDFKGEITQVGHSKRFGRPGYVVMDVEQATLPNGTTFTFDPSKYRPRHKKLHNPEAQTFPQAAAIQASYTAVSLAVTLPLYYGTKTDALPLFAVGEGVRMLAGAAFGLVRPKYKNEPVARKFTLGALDGSGIPRVVGFFTKYPEPDYHAGDTVKLYLNPHGLKDLFQSANQSPPQAMLETHGMIQAMK